jgi:hypothetical protein
LAAFERACGLRFLNRFMSKSTLARLKSPFRRGEQTGNYATPPIVAIIVTWRSGFNSGWNDSASQIWKSNVQISCEMLEKSRHNIEAHRTEAIALRALMTTYGCKVTP